MGTYAQSRTDRVLQKAVFVAAGLLALSVLALAGLYIRDRYMQPNVSLVDRQIEQATSLVRADPDNPDARVTLGNAYLTKKMYREALEQFTQVLKVNENFQAALIGAGLASLQNKQDDQAIGYFQKVIDLNKNSDYASVDRRLNGVYYELGRLYLSKGNIDDAIANLRSALTIDRTDSDALLLMGNALSAKGEYDSSFEAYRAAAAFVPNFVEAYQGMAQVSDKNGNANKAAYARAMVAFSTGKADEAIRGLENVVPNLPDFADAAVGLGLAYEAKGQKDKALEAYRKGAEIDPNNSLAQSKVTQLSRN